ncbi:MAG TPA: glycosyltransferase [Candidatus Dorea intestinavium]|nr:glycosyltransferase [Candidatus Dorea intestinavium]
MNKRINKIEKIRILHVAQAAGGVDKYIKMLFKYMDNDKFENILVCSHDFKKEDYANLADEIEYVDMQRQIGNTDISAIRTVRKLIQKYQADIVYAHSSKAGVIARVANIGMKKNEVKIKCIYNPHGWAFNMRCGKIKQIFYTVIEKMMSIFCDKIVCISDAEKQSALDKRICKTDKLQVIINGIDIEDYLNKENIKLDRISRESFGIPNNAFVIGMVGRISEQKAPDIFIKAAKKIKEKIPEAYFKIVGDGPYREEIESYAKENDIPLYITGWVENALDYINLFDVALLLSRWEGFGLVLPEYMLVGKPIIASNVDAIPNIITNGENGLLVEVDNVESVVEAVIKIYKDNTLKKCLISQGSITVYEKYDAKRVSRETEEMFEKL